MPYYSCSHTILLFALPPNSAVLSETLAVIDPQFRNDNIGVIPQFNTKQLLCLQIMQLTILGSIGNIKINKMLSSKSS